MLIVYFRLLIIAKEVKQSTATTSGYLDSCIGTTESKRYGEFNIIPKDPAEVTMKNTQSNSLSITWDINLQSSEIWKRTIRWHIHKYALRRRFRFTELKFRYKAVTFCYCRLGRRWETAWKRAYVSVFHAIFSQINGYCFAVFLSRGFVCGKLW